jgi:hypothetical protein
MERTAVKLARIVITTPSAARNNTLSKTLAEAKRERVSVNEYVRAHALLAVAGGDAAAETELVNED